MGAAAPGKDSLWRCVFPLNTGSSPSPVTMLVAACILVNTYPLLSERYALHNGRAARIKEIGALRRDGARLQWRFHEAGRVGGW